jgi:hypothetical protein
VYPGNEKYMGSLVRATHMAEPCCDEHGGQQVVIMEDDHTTSGTHPIKWMKPWLDDLDIDAVDQEIIRSLATGTDLREVPQTEMA